MKIWELEKEYSSLLSFVVEKREARKADIQASVSAIKKELLKKGEEALQTFSRRWDGWSKMYPLKLSDDEIETGFSEISKKDHSVLKGMISSVTEYHRGQKPKGRTYRKAGLQVRDEFIPIEKAMVYVPGGTAPYPSSLIMGAIPAKIAGVKEIFVATPAKDGIINPFILAACRLVGVRDVYRIGGAQAIYAFSYGIGPIPKSDIIVGPGNAYVEEAKRDVYGRVGIDMLAGPTELIILCTERIDPEAVVRDIFSQAEHDEMATVGFFSNDKEYIQKVIATTKNLISGTARRKTIEKALAENAFFVYFNDIDRAISAVNEIAPEHMELIGDEKKAKDILYPGILYLGPHSPVALGDYHIGTNHVLPTSGAGRFAGGLSVTTFMRRKVTVRAGKSFINEHADRAMRLAEIEGLSAHRDAIAIRKEL